MCGISASFDSELLKNLIRLNNRRGRHSFSLMVYDVNDGSIFSMYQGFSDCRESIIDYFNNISINLNKTFYYISHSQAPTSTDIGLDRDFNRIHPAKFKSHYLYHNGIIKDESINFLKDKLQDFDNNWDTSLLLKGLLYYSDYTKILDIIKGSYACILTNGSNIYTFRNDSSILYHDKYLNFSSINYNDNMSELPSGKIFEIDLASKLLLFDEEEFKSPDECYAFL